MTLALILLLSSVSVAHAQIPPSAYVIEPGREEEVLALFAPYRLGSEVAGGVTLANVRIEPTGIVAELAGPAREKTELRLAHPDAVREPSETSPSFAMSWDEEGDAVRALAAAVVRNDGGGFWRVRAAPRETDRLSLGRRGGALAWATDGALLFFAAFVLLLGITARQLRRMPREAAALLLACVLAGAVYRLWLAPETMLGAWPYSRTVPIYRQIWEGPALSLISQALGQRISWFEFVTTTTLLFAVATPVAVFAHATDLLGGHRRALLAAATVAVLPTHVRFSHSEVEFVPSLALAAFTFVLLHVAVRDERRPWRWIALAALPLAAGATFVTRPLNVVFLALFLADLAFVHRGSTRRRILAGALVLAAGLVSIVAHFLPSYAEQVRDGSDPAVLAQAVKALFSVKWNTLVHPGITPPVLLVAAVLGAIWRWRSERRLVIFLLAWLLAFFVTHAYVLPEETAMQARYHLHLVAPFVFLAAIGLDALLVRRPRAGLLAVALVALSPLVHADFVTDVAFNDQQEYAFVRSAAAQIPRGCTVLEHTGEGTGDHDARFGRAGTALEGFREVRLFRVHALGAASASDDPLRAEARASLSEGGCLYYFEGIPCYSERREGETLARACVAMREAAPMELVGERELDSRLYDANLDPRIDHLRLALYRITPQRSR